MSDNMIIQQNASLLRLIALNQLGIRDQIILLQLLQFSTIMHVWFG